MLFTRTHPFRPRETDQRLRIRSCLDRPSAELQRIHSHVGLLSHVPAYHMQDGKVSAAATSDPGSGLQSAPFADAHELVLDNPSCCRDMACQLEEGACV